MAASMGKLNPDVCQVSMNESELENEEKSDNSGEWILATRFGLVRDTVLNHLDFKTALRCRSVCKEWMLGINNSRGLFTSQGMLRINVFSSLNLTKLEAIRNSLCGASSQPLTLRQRHARKCSNKRIVKKISILRLPSSVLKDLQLENLIRCLEVCEAWKKVIESSSGIFTSAVQFCHFF